MSAAFRVRFTCALVVLVAACAGGGAATPSPSGTSGPVTIKLLALAAGALMQPLIDAFQAANPNITVTQEVVPFDQMPAVTEARMSARDSSIDVYVVDQPRTAANAAKGYLVDLSKSVLPLAKGKLFDAALAGSEYQGKLWDVPYWESTNLMTYNRDLLTKAGVTPPSNDPTQRWTWEQTVDAAKTVQQKTGAPCGLLHQQTDRYYQLQPLIMSAGGGTGLTGKDNLTPAINNAGWSKAMTFYQSLFKTGVTPPSVDANTSSAYFASGKCAFIVGIPAFQSLVDAKISFGIAPEPYFAGGKPVTPNQANALGISPFSTHKDAALKFVEYATLNADGNSLTTKVVTLIPANIQAATVFYAQQTAISPAALANLQSLVNYELDHTAVARPVTIGYPEFENTMLSMFSDIRTGADVQAALSNGTNQLNAAFQSLK